LFKQKGKHEVFNHGVLFYRKPNHKRQVVFNLLKENLEQERGIYYIAGDEPPKKIYQEIFNFGFDVKTLERDGMLKVVNFNEWYIIDGKFDKSNVKTLLKKTCEETLEKGLKGLFICGEMGCFFRNNLVEDLIDYEKSIGKTFKIPINALCAYNIHNLSMLEAKLFFDLIRAHNQVFSPKFAGLFDFENFYFQILSEKLETAVGKICAKEILSFLSEWRPLLDADLEGGPENLHTALESFIGSRAKRIEEKAWLKISEKLGLRPAFF
jgi:hypothetical protein